ncbi:DUF397 domain-containing protein [Streptomyces ziwulingensis]|uniref:DUF397 domain-containing protein n=1 Tax=Streptomyces ziwulingensis TaxID=1045501 RepID=A0ABP9CL43_9ACTN
MSDRLVWVKSSYSDSQGSDCVEVARTGPESGDSLTHVRDSKLGVRSPRLVVPAGVWGAFVAHARRV